MLRLWNIIRCCCDSLVVKGRIQNSECDGTQNETDGNAQECESDFFLVEVIYELENVVVGAEE